LDGNAPVTRPPETAMPRVQLEPRARYPFAWEITVRTTDLNYGGHLGNDRVLSLVHEARVAFLASHGWTELDCGGASLIMAETGLVAFDYERRRVARLPEAVRAVSEPGDDGA
jgi:acyl-CoA thioesterase FadM